MPTSDASGRRAYTLVVDEPNAGRRLDGYLRRLLPEVPLGTLMKWVRTGKVRINGKKQKPKSRLNLGDELRVPASPSLTSHATPRLPKPVIIYEDEDLLIVDKPAGL